MMTFEMLLKKTLPSLKTYVKYRIAASADREDILQDILLCACESYSALKNAASFQPWIFSIARNKCNDYYRRVGKMEEIVFEEERFPAVSPHDPVYDTVYEILDLLKPEERELLSLYYWEGCSVKELAVHLSIPEGTVKSRLYKARERFRSLYPKEESMKLKLPERMPVYTIRKKDGKPFPVVWKELMGWFLVPEEGNRLTWAIYDFPERKRSVVYEMSCEGKAEVHGLGGVRVKAVEHLGKKEKERDFIAQLSETHCRWLAERHTENGIEKYYTFLDGDVFLDNWGFGPENIGNEIHPVPKGLIQRNGNQITVTTDQEVMDVVGRYEVTIDGKTYDTICLMDIGSYDDNTISEQYLDQNGRTVLWRRFNKKSVRWLFEDFETMNDTDKKGRETLIVNGQECLHWYDCITDYIL